MLLDLKWDRTNFYILVLHLISIFLPERVLETRGVARGQVSPEFADQLTLFKPGRADYTQHITASPLGFKKISTPLETVTHTFQEAPKN